MAVASIITCCISDDSADSGDSAISVTGLGLVFVLGLRLGLIISVEYSQCALLSIRAIPSRIKCRPTYSLKLQLCSSILSFSKRWYYSYINTIKLASHFDNCNNNHLNYFLQYLNSCITNTT